jgi:hypothetical protein
MKKETMTEWKRGEKERKKENTNTKKRKNNQTLIGGKH